MSCCLRAVIASVLLQLLVAPWTLCRLHFRWTMVRHSLRYIMTCVRKSRQPGVGNIFLAHIWSSASETNLKVFIKFKVYPINNRSTWACSFLSLSAVLFQDIFSLSSSCFHLSPRDLHTALLLMSLPSSTSLRRSSCDQATKAVMGLKIVENSEPANDCRHFKSPF